MDMPDDLPVGYYLLNFQHVQKFVVETYGDLLTVSELAFHRSFSVMSLDARRLYVRLALRKGPLFRQDKLNYDEIDNMQMARDELFDNGFLDSGVEESAEVLTSLLTKSELLSLIGCLKPDADAKAKKGRRSDLLTLLEDVTAGEVRHWMPFEILRPLQLQHLLLYRLLYFGNLDQDFTEFVLTDLGLLRYEDYPLVADNRLFNSRIYVDQLLALHSLNILANDTVASGDVHGVGEVLTCVHKIVSTQVGSDAVGLAIDVARATLMRRKDRIVNKLGYFLERQGLLDEALATYRYASAPPARERRARILAKQDDRLGALCLCREISGSPLDEAELEFADRFQRRLERKMDLEATSSLAPESFNTVSFNTISFKTRMLCLPRTDEHGVEESVRKYYEDQGSKSFFVENNLFNALFGLTFWDLIFKDVPGAFFNAYQRGPADLYNPSFYQTRATEIERRLDSLIRSTSYCDQVMRDRVMRNFRTKQGIANPFVNWDMIGEELLELALARIEVGQLAGVFRRLLFDLRNNRSGFPDLVVFPEAGYELIEVKGPGDRLQANQKRWLRSFEQFAIPYRVVNVEWISRD